MFRHKCDNIVATYASAVVRNTGFGARPVFGDKTIAYMRA